MKVISINKEECIGCDLCVDLCPKIFTSTDFFPKVSKLEDRMIKCAEDAVDICPASAISIVEVD